MNLGTGFASATLAKICTKGCHPAAYLGFAAIAAAGAVAHRLVDRGQTTGRYSWGRSWRSAGVSTAVGGACGAAIGSGCVVGALRHVVKRHWEGAVVGIGGAAAAWMLRRG